MITAVRPRAAELLDRMADGALYREAYSRGMNLSAFLEAEDPSDQYRDGLDGFQRLLKCANIIPTSDPGAGYFADRFEAFDRDDRTRALVPEFMARIWRAVKHRRPETRAVLTSDLEALGSVARPYVDAATPRYTQIQPAIPLAELVAITTPIDTDAYRAFYMTEPAASEKRLVRVSEAAEIPRVTLRGGDHTIRLHKYGRALEVSYEQLRRQRIDKVAWWVMRMAVQAESDKVATALDTLINGDGNAGTAATSFNLTALDAGASAGTLTVRGWLAFKMKFRNPYAVVAAFADETTALQMRLLNLGSANVPLVTVQAQSGFGGFLPINDSLSDMVRLGVTDDVPALTIVGVDTRFALERVVEIGADITEVERWATRQTQTLVMSEVEGYAVLDAAATKILNVNA
ncbi:MAG: hypothetical protein KatS3mg060_1171 [Dehalococcoidia bacterium]|nr:MAG: hypothetical protein KatS3mg060_1171 [Dehalococcoidia bacterium]